MRAVVQLVTQGKVEIAGEQVANIGQGFVILLGVGEADSLDDSKYLADKIANLRIFTDADDKMNLSILEVGGAAIVVSQFTLYGDCRRGRRPSFTLAAQPENARQLYEDFVARLRALGITTQTGVFQADMQVSLTNDGPVTMLLDSKKEF